MPQTSQLQAQIHYFMHKLLLEYFDVQGSLNDITTKKAEINIIKEFLNIKTADIDDGKIAEFSKAFAEQKEDQKQDIFKALKSAILYVKTADRQYVDGFLPKWEEHNIKSPEYITTEHLRDEEDNIVQYFNELLPDTLPHKLAYFDYIPDPNNRLDVEVYSEIIQLQESPEIGLIQKSAVIYDHIVDYDVAQAVATKDKWRFLYHKVNLNKSLDPLVNKDNPQNAWVVIAISPENEVTCLDPNGIAIKPDAQNDIIDITKTSFKAAGLDLPKSVTFRDIKSNRVEKDSALSCCFAVHDLAKEIFEFNIDAKGQKREEDKDTDKDKNKKVSNYKYYRYNQRGDRYSKYDIALEYSQLLLKQELIANLNKVPPKILEYVKDEGNEEFYRLKHHEEVFSSVLMNKELFELTAEEKESILNITAPSEGEKGAKIADKIRLIALQYRLGEELKTINNKLADYSKRDFTAQDLLKSPIIISNSPDTALNSYEQSRYDSSYKKIADSREEFAKDLQFDWQAIKSSLKHNVIFRNENRHSGYYLDDDNNLHLVRKKDHYKFAGKKIELSPEEIAEKTDFVDLNDENNHFSALQDEKSGEKFLSVDKSQYAKYREDAMFYYFLGDISLEHLTMLDDLYKNPDKGEIKKLKSELASIQKYRDKKPEEEIEESAQDNKENDDPNNNKEGKKDDEKDKQKAQKAAFNKKMSDRDNELTGSGELSLKDIENFLHFRQYQNNNPDKKFDKALKEYIENGEEKRAKIPGSIVTNISVYALTGLDAGIANKDSIAAMGENYSNKTSSGGGRGSI